MLIDEILSNRVYLGNFGEPWGTMLETTLREAQRFVLDGDFAGSADTLSRSNIRSFEQSISACKPPFETCWIETAYSFRPSLYSPQPNGAATIGGNRTDVRRIGILFSPFAENTYCLNLAWCFATGDIQLNPITVIADLGDGSHATTMRLTTGEPLSSDPKIRAEAAIRWRGAELDASLRLDSRFARINSPFYTDLAQNPDILSELTAKRQNLLKDWDGELFYWLAALALLNSRNISQIEEADLSAINKRRQRNNKQPLLSYHLCKLSPRFKARQNSDGEREGGYRSHLVRGHFKIRQSGVFWWSPFIRGDQKLGFVIKDYKATGSREEAMILGTST